MKRQGKSTRSPLKIVVTILAVIVVLVYVAACNSVQNAAQGRSLEYDARDYVYSAEYGRYGSLYDTAIHDMAKNKEYKAEVEEYRALAFYYEQAVLEHAYKSVGNVDKAEASAERMKEYEAQLGSVSNRAEDVRNVVGG